MRRTGGPSHGGNVVEGDSVNDTGPRRPSGLIASIAFLAVMAVAAAACGSSTSSNASNTTAAPTVAQNGSANDVVIAPSGPPQSGGQMVFGVNAETDGWDPTTSRWTSAGLTVAGTMFDRLADWDSDFHAQPYLAESIDHNDAYDVWTIKMRPGVKFHDGTPVDAAAVKNDMDAIRAAILTKAAFDNITDTTVVDDLTLKVTMKIPWSAFPASLTGQAAMIAAPAQLANAETSTRKPIGSGPFTFESWTPDAKLIVKKNPDYWRSGLPYLDQIEFRPISEPQSQYDALRTGDLTMMMTGDGPTKVKLRAAANDGEFQMVNAPGETAEAFVMLNTTKAPVNDNRLRTALAYATDTATIARIAQVDESDIARGPFVPGTYWAVDSDYPHYDVDKAKSLVAEVRGSGPAPKIELQCGDANQTIQLCQAVAASWEAAGVDVAVTSMETTKQINSAVTGDYQATMWGQFEAPDPDYDSVWWYGSHSGADGGLALNFARNQDPVLDAALTVGRTSAKEEERKLAYVTVQEQLAKDVPYVWLYHLTLAIGAQNDVRGMQGITFPDGSPGSNTIAGVERLTEVWIEK